MKVTISYTEQDTQNTGLAISYTEHGVEMSDAVGGTMSETDAAEVVGMAHAILADRFPPGTLVSLVGDVLTITGSTITVRDVVWIEQVVEACHDIWQAADRIYEVRGLESLASTMGRLDRYRAYDAQR